MTLVSLSNWISNISSKVIIGFVLHHLISEFGHLVNVFNTEAIEQLELAVVYEFDVVRSEEINVAVRDVHEVIVA